MILRLRLRRKKKFGLFIIIGWRAKWNKKYVGVPDASQDIFSHHQTNIFQFTRSFKRISQTVNFDGAILVDKRGAIKRSGVILEGLRPRRLAQELYPESSDHDLSVRFGFKKKVHLRHLSAITASYELRGTTVYTVSEETGDVHIFERGKILFSTLKKEMTHAD
jgi:DNA integrity scanning protein DisA with diadenylate cyclase activity